MQSFVFHKENYNLMAEIIAVLIENNVTLHELESFKATTSEIRDANLQKISERLQALGFPKNTDCCAFQKLVEGIPEEKLVDYLIEALLYIDIKLDFGDNISCFMIERDAILSEIRDLNSNYDKTQVMILPRLGGKWNKKSEDHGINSLLNFYFFIEKQKLNGYHIRNFAYNNVGGAVIDKQFIRIGISPLTNESSLNVKHTISRGAKKAITVDRSGIGSDVINNTTKKLCRVIEKAAEQQIDILMFPEMLGTEEMAQEGLKKTAELAYQSEKGSAPFLILLPTIWGKEDSGDQKGRNTNKLKVVISDCIIDGMSYREAFSQQKPYFAAEANERGEIEDIVSDGVINLLHVPKIGRIAFPICADWLSKSYRSILLNSLMASVVLCPSFSKGLDEFIQLCALSSTEGCCIIWCNSCAVQHLYEEDKRGGFNVGDMGCAGIPRQWRTYGPKKISPLCGGQCGKEYCLFYIDVPLYYQREKTKADCLKWRHLFA